MLGKALSSYALYFEWSMTSVVASQDNSKASCYLMGQQQDQSMSKRPKLPKYWKKTTWTLRWRVEIMCSDHVLLTCDTCYVVPCVIQIANSYTKWLTSWVMDPHSYLTVISAKLYEPDIQRSMYYFVLSLVNFVIIYELWHITLFANNAGVCEPYRKLKSSPSYQCFVNMSILFVSFEWITLNMI